MHFPVTSLSPFLCLLFIQSVVFMLNVLPRGCSFMAPSTPSPSSLASPWECITLAKVGMLYHTSLIEWDWVVFMLPRSCRRVLFLLPKVLLTLCNRVLLDNPHLHVYIRYLMKRYQEDCVKTYNLGKINRGNIV